MADNQTISIVLKTISAAYPRFVVDQDTVRVWASFLTDLDNDLLMATVTRFISSASHAFAPSIPEIRSAATEIRREVAGIPSAWEAWEEVLNAPMPRPRGAAYQIWRDGQPVENDDYVWKNDVVGLVARRLGFPDGFPSHDNPIADRAHFVKAYEAEVNMRLRAETQMPLVTQYIEAQKAQNAGLIDVSRDMKKLTANFGRKA